MTHIKSALPNLLVVWVHICYDLAVSHTGGDIQEATVLFFFDELAFANDTLGAKSMIVVLLSRGSSEPSGVQTPHWAMMGLW